MGQRIFVVGASSSGIDALCELASALPMNFPAPIFIAQHCAPHSPGMLPQILTRVGNLMRHVRVDHCCRLHEMAALFTEGLVAARADEHPFGLELP